MNIIANQRNTENTNKMKTLKNKNCECCVTLNCQITRIPMTSGSQLSELQSVSQMSQVSWYVVR